MYSIFIILVCFLVIFILWIVITYNTLIRMKNAVKNAWSQIDVQLKRRHELIPNLVESVRGYMKHEQVTLKNVTKARNIAAEAANQDSSVGDRASAERKLGGVLGRLFAVAESYPDLKANQNFLSLQEELASTENRISFARQHYNDSVMQFNNKIQMIPTNIIAGICEFIPAEFFELEDETSRKAPTVTF